MNLFIFVQFIWVFDPFYCLGVFLHRSGWGGCDITRCHKRISLTKLAPFDTANTAQMGLYKYSDRIVQVLTLLTLLRWDCTSTQMGLDKF